MDVRYSIEPYIWWLPNRNIAGMPMPYFAPERLSDARAEITKYDDDLRVIVNAGLRSVVSLVNSRHSDIFSSAGIDFCAIPIPDGHAPNPDQIGQFKRFCESCRVPIAIHCEGGVGRTGTMIALWLIDHGLSNDAAIKRFEM